MTILNPAYDFLKADLVNPNLNKNFKEEIQTEVIPQNNVVPHVIGLSGLMSFLTIPHFAYAAETESTFRKIYESLMVGFDWGVVFVIVFAGAAWGLGHRTKGIELLISIACGYLVARHAIEIRDGLKAL